MKIFIFLLDFKGIIVVKSISILIFKEGILEVDCGRKWGKFNSVVKGASLNHVDHILKSLGSSHSGFYI